MNPEKETQVKRLLIGLAEYFQTTLTPGQLAMYTEDLVDLDLTALGNAIREVRRDPQHRFLPRPAALREAIVGNLRGEGQEASGRIVEAISRFGWTNPDLAKNFIGELGWRVVEREGGWMAICERTTNDDLPTLKAQWREMARATAARIAAGRDAAPALPERRGSMSAITALLPKSMKGAS